MAFWYLIAPSTANMIRVSRARRAQQRNEEIILPCTYSRHALLLLDELFLFLMYLALGSTEVDLADRFGIHPSTVSRIITTWTYYLYFLLGSLTIWLSPQEVQAVLPRKFRQSKYADTQNQMPAEQVQKTQETAHLRVDIERLIGRIKLSKLFQSDIPMSLMGSINSLWAVACLLSNYQYGPLVKTWANKQRETVTAHSPKI